MDNIEMISRELTHEQIRVDRLRAALEDACTAAIRLNEQLRMIPEHIPMPEIAAENLGYIDVLGEETAERFDSSSIDDMAELLRRAICDHYPTVSQARFKVFDVAMDICRKIGMEVEDGVL